MFTFVLLLEVEEDNADKYYSDLLEFLTRPYATDELVVYYNINLNALLKDFCDLRKVLLEIYNSEG